MRWRYREGSNLRNLSVVRVSNPLPYHSATIPVAEGEGIEPLTVRLAWFSGPVAGHSAPPSASVVSHRQDDDRLLETESARMFMPFCSRFSGVPQ